MSDKNILPFPHQAQQTQIAASATVQPPPAPATTIVIGQRYRLDHPDIHAYREQQELSGLCGGFEADGQRGGPLPLSVTDSETTGFFWDPDAVYNLPADWHLSTDDPSRPPNQPPCTPAEGSRFKPVGSRFQLIHTELDGPELKHGDDGWRLSLNARFDGHCLADGQATRFGMLTLADAQVYLSLENGETFDLLHTPEGQPALQLEHPLPANTTNAANTAIIEIGDAEPVDNPPARRQIEQSISLPIPSQRQGTAVENLTILAQYRTYFLQRPLPFSDDTIWTPASVPICWGWSIRVAPRFDGDWSIIRQKLLRPFLPDQGVEMPAWQGNTLALQTVTT